MKKYLLIGILFLGGLSGCQTFDKSIATGYGLNILTRDLSTELNNADRITPQKAIEIKTMNDKVSIGLWKAWGIRKAYPDSAKASVKTYLQSVTDIYNFLKDQELK